MEKTYLSRENGGKGEVGRELIQYLYSVPCEVLGVKHLFLMDLNTLSASRTIDILLVAQTISSSDVLAFLHKVRML